MKMKRKYSFVDNYSFENGEIDDEKSFLKKNHQRNVHVPQSRYNARSGTIGSFSSITSKYNNIYNNS